MKGVSGFNGSGAASGSSPAAEVVEKDYVGLSEAAASYATTMTGVGGVAVADDGRGHEGEEEEELELGLGLSLGAKKVTGGGTRASPWREYCRILTAKDFPPLGSGASPRSSSASSSSATLGDGGGAAAAGSKRPADSVASDVGGSGSPPSQVVVGWPPIRAFRMNTLVNQSKDSFSDSDTCSHKKGNSNNDECIGSKDHGRKGGLVGGSRFVKVNMDGDPIGRKVDLNAHLSYQTLSLALEIMFHKPATSLGNSANGTKASKLLDGSSDFALTYEDKDGDWMLVGDVPWGMFVYTVKRLRIMRNCDANGLEPRFQAPFDKSAALIRSKPA